MYLSSKAQQALVGSVESRADAMSDLHAGGAIASAHEQSATGKAGAAAAASSIGDTAATAVDSKLHARGSRLLSDVVFAAKRLGARVQASVSGKANAVVRRRAWLRPAVLTPLGHARLLELGIIDSSCSALGGGGGASGSELHIDVPQAAGNPPLHPPTSAREPLLTRLATAVIKLQRNNFEHKKLRHSVPVCTCGNTRLARWADTAGDGLVYLQLHSSRQILFTVHGSGAHSKQGMLRKAGSMACAWAAAAQAAGLGHHMASRPAALTGADGTAAAALAAAANKQGAAAAPITVAVLSMSTPVLAGASGEKTPTASCDPPSPPLRTSSSTPLPPTPNVPPGNSISPPAGLMGVDVIPIAWYEGRKARQGASWRHGGRAAQQGHAQTPDDGLESDVTQLIAAAEAQLGACLPGNLKALRHLLYVQGFTATVYTTQHIGAAMRRHSMTHMLQMWIMHLVSHPALVATAPFGSDELGLAAGTGDGIDSSAGDAGGEFQSPDPTGYCSDDSGTHHATAAPAASFHRPVSAARGSASTSTCGNVSFLVATPANVSIIAHSLGGMLTTDLMCGDSVQGGKEVRVSPRRGLVRASAPQANSQSLRTPNATRGTTAWAVDNLKCTTEGLPLLQQLLPVSALVLAGSPVPLYLSARCLRPDRILSALEQTFAVGSGCWSLDSDAPHQRKSAPRYVALVNMFHVADPVSQRLEPLLDMGRRLREALEAELQPALPGIGGGARSGGTHTSAHHHRSDSEIGMRAALQVASSMVAGSDPLSPDVGSSASESDSDSPGGLPTDSSADPANMKAADCSPSLSGEGQTERTGRHSHGARHTFKLLAGPQDPPCDAHAFIQGVPACAVVSTSSTDIGGEKLQQLCGCLAGATQGRVDFQIASSGFFDRVSEYIAASTAHGAYWSSAAAASAAVVLSQSSARVAPPPAQ